MKRKFISLILAGILTSSLYAQETPKQKVDPASANKAAAQPQPSPAPQPPQDQVGTLKLTVKLLKQASQRQAEISKAQAKIKTAKGDDNIRKAQLKLQVANLHMQIFQHEVTAKLAAQRAKDVK